MRAKTTEQKREVGWVVEGLAEVLWTARTKRQWKIRQRGMLPPDMAAAGQPRAIARNSEPWLRKYAGSARRVWTTTGLSTWRFVARFLSRVAQAKVNWWMRRRVCSPLLSLKCGAEQPHRVRVSGARQAEKRWPMEHQAPVVSRSAKQRPALTS